MQKLSELIAVDASFQRARRLDVDYKADRVDSVRSYVPQRSSKHVLEMMAEHVKGSNQRAFTWTGPYGSGKSTLALLLCSLVGGGEARTEALHRLDLDERSLIAEVFCTASPWRILALTGRQSRMIDDVARLIGAREKTSRAVVEAVKRLAANAPTDGGVLLIIDELGKYLEADCASENAYLLQELAETVNRTEKQVIVVGILHQAVDVYASRLPSGLREEWEKVKGRFVDMPLLGSAEEVIELLGRAIRTDGRPSNPSFEKAVAAAATEYAARKPERKLEVRKLLEACWPLNPVTALLLGPVSRRKFAQNERSVYSFLASLEPFGFREFAKTHAADSLYSPSNYWDYLCANFETSILSTADGHRWMTARDAVERAERKGSEEHVRLTKTLALVDLFRAGSGIEATLRILAAAVLMPLEKTKSLLEDLLAWKIAIVRHHIGAYAVFAGSDFNIDEAVSEAAAKQNGIDPATIENLLSLPPVVARSNYLRVGTLRWFERVIVPEEEFERWLNRTHPDDGRAGAFALVLPQISDDANANEVLERLARMARTFEGRMPILVFGVAESSALIRSQLEELQALHAVSKHPALEGDQTGRKEVAARTAQMRDILIGSLREAFSRASWRSDVFKKIHTTKRIRDLTVLASQAAESVFSSVPEILNELINRDHPSTNVVKARRQLMYRMLHNETEENLGYTGFPPDYALYLSMLKELRRKDEDGLWRFDTHIGNKTFERLYAQFWTLTEAYLNERGTTRLSDLYAFWRKPPIGLRFGPMPILALAYYLANREELAVYVNTTFTPSLTETVIDEWLHDPSRIALRPVSKSGRNQALVNELASILHVHDDIGCGKTPLEVARLLVRIIFESPKWSQHSTSYSSVTQQLKQTVLKASDPVKLLFHDLPAIYGTDEPERLAQALDASLSEYLGAMPKMIEHTKRILFDSLKADPTKTEDIRSRASSIKGTSGQMQLEAFIARLEKYAGKREDIEGFISLACSKPTFLWTDNDIRIAQTKLAEFAFEFRQLEALGSLLGRNTKRRVFSLVLGAAHGDVCETVELSDSDEVRVKEFADRIQKILSSEDRSIALGALAGAGYSIIKNAETN